MPKPYLIGWRDAIRAYFKTFSKHPAKRRMWIRLVKRKWFWITTEERLEANKKCMDALGEIGRKYPKTFTDYSDYLG